MGLLPQGKEGQGMHRKNAPKTRIDGRDSHTRLTLSRHVSSTGGLEDAQGLRQRQIREALFARVFCAHGQSKGSPEAGAHFRWAGRHGRKLKGR